MDYQAIIDEAREMLPLPSEAKTRYVIVPVMEKLGPLMTFLCVQFKKVIVHGIAIGWEYQTIRTHTDGSLLHSANSTD